MAGSSASQLCSALSCTGRHPHLECVTCGQLFSNTRHSAFSFTVWFVLIYSSHVWFTGLIIYSSKFGMTTITRSLGCQQLLVVLLSALSRHSLGCHHLVFSEWALACIPMSLGEQHLLYGLKSGLSLSAFSRHSLSCQHFLAIVWAVNIYSLQSGLST